MVYVHYLDCAANFMHVRVLEYTHRFSNIPPFQEQSLIVLPLVWAALSDLLLTSGIKGVDDSLGAQVMKHCSFLLFAVSWLTHSVRSNQPLWRYFPQM